MARAFVCVRSHRKLGRAPSVKSASSNSCAFTNLPLILNSFMALSDHAATESSQSHFPPIPPTRPPTRSRVRENAAILPLCNLESQTCNPSSIPSRPTILPIHPALSAFSISAFQLFRSLPFPVSLLFPLHTARNTPKTIPTMSRYLCSDSKAMVNTTAAVPSATAVRNATSDAPLS